MRSFSFSLWAGSLALIVAAGCTGEPGGSGGGGTESGSGTGTASGSGTGAGTGSGTTAGTTTGTGTNTGTGVGQPTGLPMFVAQGHFARTTLSCDDGDTWVANQSSDDTARCWSNNNQPDCDHAPDSARGIAYGEGWFVATFGWGPPGQIRRSRNGVDWEPVTSDTTFAGVAYGDGVFLAGANVPRRSTDGAATWTELGYVVDQNVRRTAYVAEGGGLFVMATDGPLLLTSDAGDNWWEPSQLPAGCGQNIMFSGGIVSGNGVIVVLGGDGLACRSTDGGQTFTSTTVASNIGSDLIFTGSEFMAWSYGERHTSSDGASWTTTPSDAIDVGPVARSDDGTLVAVNGGWQVWYEQQRFFKSSDGLTWTALDGAAYVGSHPIFDVVFGYGEGSSACN
ncbi:MAG: hypothetical protein R3B72_11780 [Polyangiaceae bacterium]